MYVVGNTYYLSLVDPLENSLFFKRKSMWTWREGLFENINGGGLLFDPPRPLLALSVCYVYSTSFFCFVNPSNFTKDLFKNMQSGLLAQFHTFSPDAN